MKKHKKLFLAFLCMIAILAASFSAFASGASSVGLGDDFRDNQASTEVLLQKESGGQPPRITEIIRDQAVSPNVEFTLDAVVEGGPFIEIEWSISRDGGSNYSNVSSGSVLFKTSQALNVPENLPYHYKLRIENEAGFDEAVVQVLVTSNPDDYSVGSITDSKTSITVTGLFHKSIRKLLVIPKAVSEYPGMASKVAADCVAFRAYQVHIVNEAGEKLPYFGMLELDFPVGTVFETDSLRVFHKRQDNRIETLLGAVSESRLKVCTDSLGPFLIETPRSKTHIITVKADPRGSVEPGGIVYVAKGENQSFVFTAEAGYKPDKVKLDGKEMTFSGNTFTLAKVNQNHLLEVTFRKPPLPGEGSGGGSNTGNTGGGSGGGSNTGNTGGGSGGSSNTGNTGGGSGGGSNTGNTGGGSGTGNSGSGTGIGTPEEGTQNELHYKITPKSQGYGKISPSKTVTVKHGESKTFYFYPDKGYEVDQVWVNGVPMTVFWNSYTITAATEDAVLEVRFKPRTFPPSNDTHTVTAFASPGGTISPEGVTTVRYGGDLYVYFRPDKGYRTSTVTIDGKTVPVEGGSYHFINVTSDRVVEATFEKGEAPEIGKKFTVKASVKGGGGSVSPGGDIWVNENGSQTIYFYPQEGYELDRLTVNGMNVEVYEGSYTLENISEDMDVVVSFRAVSASGVSCDCKLCSLLGVGCICPWCWLVPLLLLVLMLAVIWNVCHKKNTERQS